MDEAKRRGTLAQRIAQPRTCDGISTTSIRRRAAAQPGIAPGEQFVARTPKGTIIDPSSVVYPILRHVGPGADSAIVGTGFFIAQNVLLTAKHVVDIAMEDDPEGNAPLWCVDVCPAEGQRNTRPIVRTIGHETSDIAVCVLEPLRHVATGEPLLNRILPLSDRDPEIGEQVFTYAFPDSVVEPEGHRLSVDLSPHFYDGLIVEHHSVRRDAAVLAWPCFQTSIHIHGGASGGPVFDSTGAVFGINTLSMEPQTDISYVTKVRDAFDLPIPTTLTEGGAEQLLPLRELAARGLARIHFAT